ncbi:hypothetical protein BACT_1218 [Bifidobacterium actinocoloniiforme DSM 22766]|uniref:Uncharacterized protein n=1 Tax=Bifidobacterium actinocoloniiforme DSM 22766 TaxID=1437605 RepID=A0A086Z1W4_9BIFI|nr:hypothetical protein [Bifidobacterium actinocoloniiforme]AKV55612.1 hypothetical protein AB656_04720 [Bifidobacterium actinocoloniiforme DSM 22766]KFI40514.1 hypothetical protein BACT_1218 [Bifidobacterium actinocoloniiforme DSM 22766]
MTYAFDGDRVDGLAALPQLGKAADAGAHLIGLWPLNDATQLDNDAKYGENLQVRMTQTFARIMTGEDVTIPDAEFVYEGADQIPGRPQSIVDALLAAEDACDGMAGYAQSGDFSQVRAAADLMAAGWSDQKSQAGADVAQAVLQAMSPEGQTVEASADPQVIAQRLAASMLAAWDLAHAVGAGSDEPARALPVLLFANELNERFEIPRFYVSDEQLVHLLGQDSLQSLAEQAAPLVQAEWDGHRDDLLWDPDEAKRQAKEEDERKSREALKAKFAHVPEDPHKPPVEL